MPLNSLTPVAHAAPERRVGDQRGRRARRRRPPAWPPWPPTAGAARAARARRGARTAATSAAGSRGSVPAGTRPRPTARRYLRFCCLRFAMPSSLPAPGSRAAARDGGYDCGRRLPGPRLMLHPASLPSRTAPTRRRISDRGGDGLAALVDGGRDGGAGRGRRARGRRRAGAARARPDDHRLRRVGRMVAERRRRLLGRPTGPASPGSCSTAGPASGSRSTATTSAAAGSACRPARGRRGRS